MKKSCFTTPTQALNTLYHSKTHMFTIYIQRKFYTFLCNTFLFSHAIPIELTDTDNYLPPDAPNVTNLMVSHYDCEKQHNLREFNLLLTHTQNPHKPSLSRFELFPHPQTFCGKPEPLYTTQYSDLLVTYQEGFNMHTGQPNPQPLINDYIFGKIVLDSTTKHYNFPALNYLTTLQTFTMMLILIQKEIILLSTSFAL